MRGDVFRKVGGVWSPRRGNILGDGPIPLVEYLPTHSPLDVDPNASIDPGDPFGYTQDQGWNATNIGMWVCQGESLSSVVPFWRVVEGSSPAVIYPGWGGFNVIHGPGTTVTPPAGVTRGHLGPTGRVPPADADFTVSRSIGLYQFPVSYGRVCLTTATGYWETYTYHQQDYDIWRVNASHNEPLPGCIGFSTSVWLRLADDKVFIPTGGDTRILRKPRNLNATYFPDFDPTFDLYIEGAYGHLCATVLLDDGTRVTITADQALIPIAEWILMSVDWMAEH